MASIPFCFLGQELDIVSCSLLNHDFLYSCSGTAGLASCASCWDAEDMCEPAVELWNFNFHGFVLLQFPGRSDAPDSILGHRSGHR